MIDMLKKNDFISLKIESITNEGSGVGRHEGMAVFVPMSAPGDLLQVRIVKVLSSYCYGIIHQVLELSSCRAQPGCTSYKRCGGCSLRHLTYEAELAAKESWVADAIRRIGGFDHSVLPILPSPLDEGYRNKAQYPIGKDPAGRAFCGFFARRTHDIIPGEDCRLQPEIFASIARAVCRYIDETGGDVYDEASGKGLFRHLYLRRGEATGQVMACLVAARREIPQPQRLVEAVRQACPQAASILLNVNPRRTNVILGAETVTLWGEPRIRDILCGVEVSISPLSFYQVNRQGAQVLYGAAARLAALRPGDTLLDLYCGAGTIGLSMAGQARELIGVEVVKSAVRDARKNAARAGIGNCRFLCADASRAAAQLVEEGVRPDVVVVDPPRKGCDPQGLEAIAAMAPQRVVYVSCNPATQARDLRLLAGSGYQLESVQPVDMFPRTAHVETVCLLSKLNVDHHIEVDLNMDELDLTSAESKATYDEIKAYVLEHSGLKVSSLYISQVKRKLGLEVGANYNLPKSEDSKQPQCPEDKEWAIEAALKHFKML